MGGLKMKDFSNEAYYLFFSTLANRTRLAIIDVLKDGPKSISEISAALEQGQDIISANLKLLEKCVLVISESSGNDRIYSLNKEIAEPLSQVLEFHTAKHCPGLSECIPQEKLRDYMKKEATKETFI
jgi:DNA-binding transcriptional ArsR family regulator